MQHIKYRKTPHMADIIKHVRKTTQSVQIGDDWVVDSSIPLPTVHATATVKLHGTNLGVVQNSTGMWFQSRERIITPLSDNAGSAAFCETRKREFENIFEAIRRWHNLPDTATICIYGEFVGQGIFHVGVSQLPKSFFIFSVECDGKQLNESWIDWPSQNIYNILNMPTWKISLDFNKPEVFSQQLQELVDHIDKKCPVAEKFGIDGVGEGVVVSFLLNDEHLVFKVKGESHSKSNKQPSKPKPQKDLGLIGNIADAVLPEWRLHQQYHLTVDTLNGGVADKSMLGKFIKNVASDIISECGDVFTDNGVEYGYVAGEIANRCRIYFLTSLT